MDFTRLAELVESAAAALAVARLIQLRLAGQFPALLVWMAFLATDNLVLALIPQDSALYFYLWIATIPLEMVAGILAVRELFALVFRNYPGISSVGRWGMYAGLTVATITTVLVNRALGTAEHPPTPVFVFELAHRTVVFGLAVIIATIMMVVSRYPLKLGSNTYISSSLFSAMFLSEALRLLLDSFQTLLNHPAVDAAEALFLSVCMVLWAALLQPAEARAPASVPFSSQRETQLLGQLATLNQLLDRAGRQ